MNRQDFVTLSDALDLCANEMPDINVAWPNAGMLTYRQLDDDSSRVAAGLAHIGVGLGDRVLYIGEKSPSFWEVLFACVKLGAVMVPVDQNVDSEDVDYVLEQSFATAIVRCSDCHVILNVRDAPEINVDDGWDEWKTQFAPLMEYCFVTPDTPIVEEFTFGRSDVAEYKMHTHEDWFLLWMDNRVENQNHMTR
ncbi:AMP-binding protein [Corynebacterium freiburgense]|uniref:AMP-binding protein n=1 Tax=Corynebacterium freiburgense TaxID=556548 RepID=UPI0003F958D6|nr:AMP-binding protein [Corynebacterium freiburgense]WJZ03788.1 Plipastatin synthase subunit D [Corynebacterium freiburgense]